MFCCERKRGLWAYRLVLVHASHASRREVKSARSMVLKVVPPQSVTHGELKKSYTVRPAQFRTTKSMPTCSGGVRPVVFIWSGHKIPAFEQSDVHIEVTDYCALHSWLKASRWSSAHSASRHFGASLRKGAQSCIARCNSRPYSVSKRASQI